MHELRCRPAYLRIPSGRTRKALQCSEGTEWTARTVFEISNRNKGRVGQWKNIYAMGQVPRKDYRRFEPLAPQALLRPRWVQTAQVIATAT